MSDQKEFEPNLSQAVDVALDLVDGPNARRSISCKSLGRSISRGSTQGLEMHALPESQKKNPLFQDENTNPDSVCDPEKGIRPMETRKSLVPLSRYFTNSFALRKNIIFRTSDEKKQDGDEDLRYLPENGK